MHKQDNAVSQKEHLIASMDFWSFYRGMLTSLRGNKGDNAMALCPFHDDRHPSLSVNLKNGLYNCFACAAKGDVIRFYMNIKNVNFKTAIKEISEMNNTTLTGKNRTGTIVGTYEYQEHNGKTLYIKERVEPGRDGRSKEFRFRHLKDGKRLNGRGSDPVLYNLPELAGDKLVFIVEGEGKVDCLKDLGLTATCLDTGAKSPWREDYLEAFKGKERVVILPDNDEPGLDYAVRIARAISSTVKDVRIVELPRLGESEDIVDWLKMEGNDRERLLGAVEGTPPWGGGFKDVVNEVNVVSVDSEFSDCPSGETSFPFHVLPRGLQNFTREIGDALNIDQAIAASSALTILSGAIGNAVRIYSKPDYSVAPFIWHAIIARSGYGKSPLISRLMEPVYKLQAKTHYETNKRCSNTTGPVQSTMTHFLVTDCTVEALSNIFASSPRGIIAHQDELAGLIHGLNQYKSTGNDKQQYLQLFNAESWKIDRKGDGGSKFIPNTGIAIIGGIQPKVFTKVFKEDSIDNGFLPRFIFIHGSNIPPRFSRKELTELPYWTELIEYCYGLKLNIGDDGYVVPDRLSLDDDGLDLYVDFYNHYMSVANRDESVGVFISKLVSHYTLKFAGILHLVKSYEETSAYGLVIDKETVGQAIELAKFFMGQAYKTVGLYTGSKEGLISHQKHLISCLTRLEDKVQKGTIPLSLIVEEFNHGLPAGMQCTPKGIGHMLKELDLSKNKGTGNYTCLVWEPEKISRLHPETKLTSLTMLTPQHDALQQALRN